MISSETRIWFISDTHFCHNKDFLYTPRGFTNIADHDITLMHNWNSVVAPDDIVYHLGDVILSNTEKGIEILKRLNGQIHIIRGNHDTEAKINLYKDCPNVVEVVDAKYLTIGKKYHFYLSHYPTITSNFDDGKNIHKAIINIFGHTHQIEKFYNNNPFMYCVCADAHHNAPVEFSTIVQDIKAQLEKE